MIVITATERYYELALTRITAKITFVSTITINVGQGDGEVGGRETQRKELVERGSRAQEYPNI